VAVPAQAVDNDRYSHIDVIEIELEHDCDYTGRVPKNFPRGLLVHVTDIDRFYWGIIMIQNARNQFVYVVLLFLNDGLLMVATVCEDKMEPFLGVVDFHVPVFRSIIVPDGRLYAVEIREGDMSVPTPAGLVRFCFPCELVHIIHTNYFVVHERDYESSAEPENAMQYVVWFFICFNFDPNNNCF
jgi:hypothetical protein